MNRFTRNRPLFGKSTTPPVVVTEKRKSFGGMIWRGIKRTCTIIGAFVLVSVLLGIFSAAMVEDESAPPIPKDGVLYLEFGGELTEVPERGGFPDPFLRPAPTVQDIVDAIDYAATDKRIKSIAARLYEGDLSMVHAREIRNALARFKAAGKRTRIYSSSYGGIGSGGMGRFYLASIFDERWVQPMGVISIAGVRAEVPFFGEVLAKLGITPQFMQKREYKTAYESFMRSEITPENKLMLQDLVSSIRDEIMRDVPNDLKMDPAHFRTLVDKGIFTADEAVKNGLVTHSDYADVMLDKINEETTGDIDFEGDVFVDVENYLEQAVRKHHKTNADIALIYVVGAIMEDAEASAPMGAEGIAAADEIATALLDAADDETIKAVVLRIDSPGGSPVASETILRAVEKVKEEGKPVIVSMASMAASGGYWIAAYADRIFAQPTTLTGSIGVVGGKVAIGDMWDKIGVNWNDEVAWGQNAGIWSINSKYSETEAAQIDAMLEDVYSNFIARVAKGRKMDVSAVDKLAHGRVWTGAQAVKNGLVDEIGGLNEALNFTASKLDLKDRTALNPIIMPRPKTFREELMELMSGGSSVYENLKIQARIMDNLKPLIGATAQEPALIYAPARIK